MEDITYNSSLPHGIIVVKYYIIFNKYPSKIVTITVIAVILQIVLI